MAMTGEKWGRGALASMFTVAFIVALGSPRAATAAPTVVFGASRLHVGVAIDSVVASHEEELTVLEGNDGDGVLLRPLPDGALLVAASLEACGVSVEARPIPAARTEGASDAADGVRFPLGACTRPVIVRWSYFLPARFEAPDFAVDLPGADEVKVVVEAGADLWKLRSETHRLRVGPLGHRAEAEGKGPREAFSLRWRVAHDDIFQLAQLAFADPLGDGGCVIAVVPPARARRRDPIVLTVGLDVQLGAEALARIGAWYERILGQLGPEDRVNFARYDSRAAVDAKAADGAGALLAVEAVAKDKAGRAALDAWATALKASSGRLPGLARVFSEIGAESTPARWKRLAVVFGGAPPLSKAVAARMAKETTPIRGVVVGDGAASGWPSSLGLVPWGTAWDAASGPFPATLPVPVGGRGGFRWDRKGEHALGDLWSDTVLVWSDYAGRLKKGGGPCPSQRGAVFEVELAGGWADAPVAPREVAPGDAAARALSLRARVDPEAKVGAAVKKKAEGLLARGKTLGWALPPGANRAPRGWRPLAAVGAEAGAPPGEWRDDGAGARGRAGRLARRPFKVRTVASRVGGRSGTQLRDRLERHRDALEIAFGADLPRATHRARRAVLDLTVSAAGAVTAVALRLVGQPAGQPDTPAIPASAAVLERLAFDPLPGGDGLETRLSVELDLR